MIIGITGFSGSGKSHLTHKAAEESNLSIAVIDADKVGHKCLRVPEYKARIIDTFGKDILNELDEIDRKKLGQIVFKDEEQLDKLNAITHGYIYSEIKTKVATAKKEHDLVLIDAALLHQIGLDELCDKTIRVSCDFETNVNSISKRDGIDSSAAVDRLQAQAEKSLKYTTDITITNDFDEGSVMLFLLTITGMYRINNFKQNIGKIPYTLKHKVEMVKLEKRLTGEVSISTLLHDTDKIVMYMGMPFANPKTIHDLHRKTARHHQYEEFESLPLSVLKEMLLDWESARFTKPDKPMRAREFCETKKPKMYKKLKPILDLWEI